MRVFLTILSFFAFSQWTYGQGLIFNDEEYKKAPVKAHLSRGEGKVEMPPSFSLKKYAPRPGNQLYFSTSVGWAIAWQARTILYAKDNELTATEEIIEHIFSPAYVYQQAKKKEDESCMTGITLEEGLEVVKKQGVPYFKDFLYFCGGEIDDTVEEKAEPFKISSYSKLFDLSDDPEEKIKSVKKAISEELPVVIGVISPPSLKRAKEFWQPTEKPTVEFGGQAMCVVGYDDNKFGGAFEVVNSWGKDWGNEGFIWIRYSDFENFVRYAYEVFDLPKSKPAKLGGKVVFRLENEDVMPVSNKGNGYYRMRDVYTSGTSFRINITTEDPAFVYVFGSDLTNECFPIFPHMETISAAVTYKHDRITIPDEEHYIQFDNTSGTDYLCVLYSREELDFNAILKQVEASEGNFPQRVRSVFEGKLLNNRIVWNQEYVSFRTSDENGSLVAVMIEVEHR